MATVDEKAVELEPLKKDTDGAGKLPVDEESLKVKIQILILRVFSHFVERISHECIDR